MADYLRCKKSFMANVDGVRRTITVGMLVDAADPVCKGRERLFEPVADAAARLGKDRKVDRAASIVESATAEPGERRTLGRRRKVVADEAMVEPVAEDKKDD